MKTVGLIWFFIEFICIISAYRAVICENEKRTISCIAGQTLRVVRALYGRTDQTTCWTSTITTHYCAADYSLYKVYDLCNGKHTCELSASNAVFTDPCVNTTKYLDVEYFCEEKGSICEGNKTTLLCPGDGKIIVVDGKFGRTNNSTCVDERMINLDCEARLSLDIVLHECHDRQTCNLQASTSSFGDPCPDTSKYLAVSYRCS